MNRKIQERFTDEQKATRKNIQMNRKIQERYTDEQKDIRKIYR